MSHSEANFKDAAGKRFMAAAVVFFIALPLLPAVLAWVNHFSA